ncbi:PREDICTED: uncharacterized protein LOC109211411 [Nicotiana attenuata]|uniref:uncharacterized protein LOC109211411 n=1 Tax=Nicotiana attenuata TaxID=49451 RepID=UPI00090526BA|nr:PREDICTED: uncharacterized protein LOC109211411 [Nicotiana attenuata]
MAAETTNSSQGQQMGQLFTEGQYKQILELLNKTPAGDCYTLMAGITTLLSDASLCEWVVDTGASHHITCHKEILSNIENIEQHGNHKVQVPTGSKCIITHKGNTPILQGYELKDVLYVPDFKFNLLSVSKLTKELLCCALFFPDFCVFQGLYNGKVMGIGRENCGLYILKWRDKPIAALVTKDTDECSLSHMRLRHLSIMSMKHISALKNKVVHSLQHKCETQFDMNVKVLRSNNGREFFNSSCSALLASLGIVHQSSCPYTPQQNGVVERKHKHILEMARALQFQSSVPSRFWGDRIKTVVYLINRWPTSILQGKSPYEVLYNKIPIIDHLKVFGCLCFSSNLPKGDKFAKRARKSVLIGYSKVQKGYRLFDLETKTIFVSRDVSFREHIFPFKENVIIPQDPFPTQASIPPYPDSSLPISTDPHIPPTYNIPATKNTNTPTTEVLHLDHTDPNTETTEVEHDEQDTYTDLVRNTESEMNVTPDNSTPVIRSDQEPRKTTRTSKPLVWLKDYQTTQKFSGQCLYPLTHTLTYANLTAGYQA